MRRLLLIPCLALALAVPAPVAAADPSLDALMPGLEASVERYGDAVGVSVIRLADGARFGYRASARFVSASSIKVALLCALLERREAEGRELSAAERADARVMIRVSDNAAATRFFAKVGRGAGIVRFFARHGFGTVKANSRSWGYTQVSPAVTARLFAALAEGSLLTAPHRRYVSGLLRSVVDWQRFGVGESAPADSVVAIKNGWVPAPDGRWTVNSTAYVVLPDGQGVVVSVFGRGFASFPRGRSVVRSVAGALFDALGAAPPAPSPTPTPPSELPGATGAL